MDLRKEGKRLLKVLKLKRIEASMKSLSSSCKQFNYAHCRLALAVYLLDHILSMYCGVSFNNIVHVHCMCVGKA